MIGLIPAPRPPYRGSGVGCTSRLLEGMLTLTLSVPTFKVIPVLPPHLVTFPSPPPCPADTFLPLSPSLGKPLLDLHLGLLSVFEQLPE